MSTIVLCESVEKKRIGLRHRSTQAQARRFYVPRIIRPRLAGLTSDPTNSEIKKKF